MLVSLFLYNKENRLLNNIPYCCIILTICYRNLVVINLLKSAPILLNRIIWKKRKRILKTGDQEYFFLHKGPTRNIFSLKSSLKLTPSFVSPLASFISGFKCVPYRDSCKWYQCHRLLVLARLNVNQFKPYIMCIK